MAKDFRIGIFGMRRGSSFLNAYRNLEGVKVVGVAESDTAVLDNLRPNLPEGCAALDNFDDLMALGLDAIVLANCFHEHGKYAIPALKAGVAVLSETNAAPTLGELVDLVETVETTGVKYMLAANVPHMFGCREMDRLYKEGTFGRVLYAEAEYLHPSDPNVDSGLSGYETHWRKWLPRTYYNMHDLGTLMSITGTLPKKVNAKAVFAPDLVAQSVNTKHTGDVVSIILNEMDNGAIFRTTACGGIGPIGKWFRLSCANGTLETVRGDQDSLKYAYNPWSKPEGREISGEFDARPTVISDAMKAAGHGGSDYSLDMMFLEYLRGNVTPFFDVYRAASLASAGILAWRSCLDNGNGYDIPDFTDKKAREKIRGDRLTPFPNPDGTGITLPCSSKPFNKADYVK